MQREIKFRAFDKKAKTIHDVSSIDFENKEIFIYDKNGFDKNLSFDEIELMQFTGLYDKNGTEVYEGDVLKDEKTNVILKVIEWRGAFKFLIDETDDRDNLVSAHRILDNNTLEIIGNIYENPELLN